MSRFAGAPTVIWQGVSDISWRIVPQIYSVEFFVIQIAYTICILILFTQMSRVVW